MSSALQGRFLFSEGLPLGFSKFKRCCNARDSCQRDALAMFTEHWLRQLIFSGKNRWFLQVLAIFPGKTSIPEGKPPGSKHWTFLNCVAIVVSGVSS